MEKQRKRQLDEFQNIIGIQFNNINYLNVALTHSSYSNQYNLTYNDHNERLEFLGDSVLSLVVSEYLYKKFISKHEGKLTRIRAGVVCEGALAEISRRLNVNKYLRIGKGEELSGGREKDSLLADACEAIIAAIYLDSGVQKAREFIIKNLGKKIEKIGVQKNYNDFKSKLQEYVQRDILAEIKYNVSNEEGPAHDKTFEVEVYLDNKSYGIGRGKSKKEAEQMAAKKALKNLEVEANE